MLVQVGKKNVFTTVRFWTGNILLRRVIAINLSRRGLLEVRLATVAVGVGNRCAALCNKRGVVSVQLLNVKHENVFICILEVTERAAELMLSHACRIANLRCW